MSKARLVITAIEIEGRKVAEVARTYDASRSWTYELLARYRAEGDVAFEPRSRRPKTSPTAIAPATIDLIIRLRKQLTEYGMDAGPDTIAWHLQHHHNVQASTSTIARTLNRQGLVVPQPKKRPKASYIRFAAEQPNETWQSDFTHYRLTDGTPAGTDIEILTWLDDHSRYALHVSAHRRITGRIVLDTFRDTAAEHGYPASVLSDNGMVYTARFSGGRGGRTALETELHRLNITQKNSRPNHRAWRSGSVDGGLPDRHVGVEVGVGAVRVGGTEPQRDHGGRLTPVEYAMFWVLAITSKSGDWILVLWELLNVPAQDLNELGYGWDEPGRAPGPVL